MATRISWPSFRSVLWCPAQEDPLRHLHRVSTDQGLDQEFNSLDAQREASEAYIKSQAHEGWTCLKQVYDDGGYSEAPWSALPSSGYLRT